MSVDSIINGDLDLYEYLGVDPAAGLPEVRRRYRQAALVYHPDKNSSADAGEKFHLLNQIYEILSSDQLRRDYDEIRAWRRDRTAQAADLDMQTKRFKDELLKAETRSTFDKVDRELRAEVSVRELERLREEGIGLRRRMEQHSLGQNPYVAYTDIPLEMRVRLGRPGRQAVVRWKHRRELEGQFTVDTVKDIMAVFGPVAAAHEIPSESYRAAVVEFERPDDMARAVGHDYRRSATLWDGTPYRKLASLLRSCGPYDVNDDSVVSRAIDHMNLR